MVESRGGGIGERVVVADDVQIAPVLNSVCLRCRRGRKLGVDPRGCFGHSCSIGKCYGFRDAARWLALWLI